jgi:hypothetical protein
MLKFGECGHHNISPYFDSQHMKRFLTFTSSKSCSSLVRPSCLDSMLNCSKKCIPPNRKIQKCWNFASVIVINFWTVCYSTRDSNLTTNSWDIYFTIDTIGMVFPKHYTDAKFRDHHIHQGLQCSRATQKNARMLAYHKNQPRLHTGVWKPYYNTTTT